MAILIHKIKKKVAKDTGVTFVFQMTPEKSIKFKRESISIKIHTLNLYNSRNILISDRDRKTQNDLEMYLNVLDYPNFRVINNPKNLLSIIKNNSNVFCLCDYRILNMPDWDFISKRRNDALFSVVALTPGDCYRNVPSGYQSQIVGTLKKPVQLNALRKILFKFMGPPLKRVAQ